MHIISTEQRQISKFSAPPVKSSTVSTGWLNTLLCLHLHAYQTSSLLAVLPS